MGIFIPMCLLVFNGISVIKSKRLLFVEKMIEKALCQIERFLIILWCVLNVPQALAISFWVQQEHLRL